MQCVAIGDTGMQTGNEAPGRTMGFELFDEIAPEEVGAHRRASARSRCSTRCPPRAAGCPSCCKRGAGGVLFHEACGHGLEADHVDKDASVFTGQVGELVASPLVTLVDDGRYAREWGTLAIDDEGHPAQRNVLIEDGVLTDYMWDLVRARKDGRAQQRQRPARDVPAPADAAHDQHVPARRRRPIPTTSSATSSTASTASQLGGGQVDPATGDFVFGITEAYLIENGEITEPIRAAQLIGNGPETLRLVDAVGNDFDTWTGMCGKHGQSVPVSSGQPTVRVAR